MNAAASEPTKSATISRFALDFDRTCATLALLLIALRVLLIPIPPHDFWWHMAQGRTIFTTQAVPHFDTFSWTRPGAPYYDQSWLAQAIFYAQNQIGGIAFIIFVQALLIVISYALVLKLTAQRIATERGTTHSSLRISALVLAAVTICSFDNWLVRPQSYAIPLFAAFFFVLTRYRLGQAKVLWPLPLLMILWVNMHGSFVLAVALLILVLLCEWIKHKRGTSQLNESAIRKLALWSAITVAAIVVNPRGLEVLSYVKMMLLDPSNKFSAEWLSPTPRNLNDAMFFAFALLFWATLIYAKRRPDPTDVVLVIVFFWLAITSGRYIIWFVMVAMPPLALAIASHLPQNSMEQKPSIINTALVGLFALLLLPCLPWLKPALGLPSPLGDLVSTETPVRAVKVLLSQLVRPQRLYHSAPTGSYLTWAAPQQKVFIDTRFEFYPPQQWRDYLQLQSGENVKRVLRQYGFDGLLLDNQQEASLVRQIRRNPQWREAYRDAHFTLFLPQTSA
jgi:hypothetical protein